MPGRGRGGPGGPFGRLRPVEQDPLESIGLPSKGDTRLLDHKTQERYYTRIIERYLTFCTDAGQREALMQGFSSLGTTANTNLSSTTSASKQNEPSRNKALSDVLMALRKLREGIVASKRVDEFAVQVYLFNIRTSVMAKQYESYFPAIMHLLRTIHPQQPLTSLEYQEVVGLLILDSACRKNKLAEAFSYQKEYGHRDAKVGAALRALTHDNYVLFVRVRQGMDGHCARMMEFAEKRIREHTLKCIGKTYLSVDLGFLERTTQSTWDDLTKKDAVGWELEADKVIIRKVRAR